MRIVVVEDEAPIREGMAKLLSKINPEYELVGKAADGEAGYQLIRELNPDLVIMDIRFFPWKILCWPVCMVRCARIHN